jgi:phosphoribosylanthranilate isomerase
MTRVKICGINDEAAFDAAVEAGADWVGFVFFPPSPRYVASDQAAALSSRAGGGPQRVGLFVGSDEEHIAAVLKVVRLDLLQLYGPATNLAALRSRFGLPIWRACGIAAAEHLPESAEGADALVLEAKPPANATRPGGNALSFDWAVLRGWTPPAPWILAGGLTPENVRDAIRASGARAVDVSSGVERAPGDKDPDLIRSFIRSARSA